MPRVTVYQGRPCARIPPAHLDRIRKTRPDFLCLPEYFWVPPSARDYAAAARFLPAARAALEELSRDLGCVVVGGTYVVATEGGLANTAPVYERGRRVGEQPKVNPTARERAHGVRPGSGFHAIPAGGLRLGVVVCADVLDRASFARMGELGVDLVFAPTLSPYLAGDTVEAKETRDRDLYQAGAVRARAPVVKCCGVGRIFGGRLQGRSLVAAADGRLLARVPFDREGRVRLLTVRL